MNIDSELLARYAEAGRHVANRDLPYIRPSGWARRSAEIEPKLEDALGGSCWNYPDRATVCAAMCLIDLLAGIGRSDKRGREGLAEGFRAVALMVENGGRADA